MIFRVFFISLILLSGCNNKDKIPSDIISPKKMQAVVWDLMRADQFLTQFVLNKDSSLNKKQESVHLYQQVFDLHQISKEKFNKSYAYYKSNLALFKTLMDSISQPKKTPNTIYQPTNVDTIHSKQSVIKVFDSSKFIRRLKKRPHN